MVLREWIGLEILIPPLNRTVVKRLSSVLLIIKSDLYVLNRIFIIISGKKTLKALNICIYGVVNIKNIKVVEIHKTLKIILNAVKYVKFSMEKRNIAVKING